MSIAERRNAAMTVAVILALTATACSSPAPTSATTPSASSPAAATAEPVANPATGPMTGDELVWIEGLGALHRRMDAILNSTGSSITEATMRAMAKKFANCTKALDRLPPVTDRLQPVHDVASQACKQYEKTAACFAAGKNCGFTEFSSGSFLFGEAEIKAETIKSAAR